MTKNFFMCFSVHSVHAGRRQLKNTFKNMWPLATAQSAEVRIAGEVVVCCTVLSAKRTNAACNLHHPRCVLLPAISQNHVSKLN